MNRTRFALAALLLTLGSPAYGDFGKCMGNVRQGVASMVESWPTSADDSDAFVSAIIQAMDGFNASLAFVPDGLSYFAPKEGRAHNLLNVFRAPTDNAAGTWDTEFQDHRAPRFIVQAGALLSEGKQAFSLLYWEPRPGYTFVLKVSPYGKTEHFALWWPTPSGSRALEMSFYPNGNPHFLGSWENSKPSGLQVLWEPAGKKHAHFGKELFAGDPRLHPDRSLSDPPSAVSSEPFTMVEPLTDAITISLLPSGHPVPAAESQPRLPRILPRLRHPDSERPLKAPELPGWDIVAWSQNGALVEAPGNSPKNQALVLTVHYDGHVTIPDPQLRDALSGVIGIEPGQPIALSKLHSITELDLPAHAIKSLAGLWGCTALKSLNLSENTLDYWKLFAYGDRLLENVNKEAKPTVQSPLTRLVMLTRIAPDPPLEELVLDGNPIPEFSMLPLLPSLQRLSLNDMKLTRVPPLYGQEKLESLSLTNNLISDLMKPPALPALKQLDLSNNQLANLERWTQTDWAIPGLVINLEGNPLTDATLEDALPLLKARGMRIDTSQKARGIDGDADPDKDGYSNRDERRFVRLLSADQEEVNRLYADAIRDPETPKRYLSLLPEAVRVQGSAPLPIDSIPVVPVSIVIQGKGTVYPGTGTHSFALYVFNDDDTWKNNTLVFKPVPEDGWQLKKRGTIPGENPYELTLNPRHQVSMFVAFEPGAVEFQVLPTEAVSKFVQLYFPDEDILTFDMNDLEADYSVDKTVYYLAPNGLPDMAEAAVLELVLQTPSFDDGKRIDFYFDFWCDSWFKNLAQAQFDVKGRDGLPEWAPTVIAVYTTMGADRRGVVQLLKDTMNLEIDLDRYITRLFRCFGPRGHLTNDSDWMEDHWEHVTKERAVDMETFRLFAESVLREEVE